MPNIFIIKVEVSIRCPIYSLLRSKRKNGPCHVTSGTESHLILYSWYSSHPPFFNPIFLLRIYNGLIGITVFRAIYLYFFILSVTRKSDFFFSVLPVWTVYLLLINYISIFRFNQDPILSSSNIRLVYFAIHKNISLRFVVSCTGPFSLFTKTVHEKGTVYHWKPSCYWSWFRSTRLRGRSWTCPGRRATRSCAGRSGAGWWARNPARGSSLGLSNFREIF